MKPIEHEYSSHVVYTRALEDYCNEQADRISELESSPTIEACRQMIESKCAIENAALYQTIAEQAAQIELMRNALDDALPDMRSDALRTQNNWKASDISIREALEKELRYGSYRALALSITPSQVLAQYRNKVLEDAAIAAESLVWKQSTHTNNGEPFKDHMYWEDIAAAIRSEMAKEMK